MRIRKSFIIGIIITILLLLGAVVAYYLSQQQQDVRQRASTPVVINPFDKAVSLAEQEITTSETFDLSKDFTIELWIKPEATISDSSFPILNTFVNEDTDTCTDSLTMTGNIMDQGSTFAISTVILPFDVAGRQLLSTSRPLSFNQWNHIALTVNATGVAKLYVNGGLADTQTLGRPFCSITMLKLGSELQDGGTTGYFQGQMDELRVSKSLRYPDSFTPSASPFTPDESTLGLWHFNLNLANELTTNEATSPDTITYVDSTIASVQPPVCQGVVSTCSWDAAANATSYIVTVKETVPGTDAPVKTILDNKQVNAPATQVTFLSEANRTYSCEVVPVNACGEGSKGSDSVTCIAPTATPTPTNTPTPVPSSTPTATPTGTPSPTPTNTPTPIPSSTPVPTNTPTPVPSSTPTATPTPTTVIATNTPNPTNTPTPTNTPVPGVATDTPTPTLASPGSAMQTFTIVGGIILTILGALILFAL